MKNKGFTLIELLAVIVILAIIALITTPIVLNTIKDSKEESNKISIDMYARALKNALLEYRLNEKKLEITNLITTDGKNFSNVKDLKVAYKGNVVCDTIEVYEETSIYLANCKVNGKEVEYTYGKKISFADASWETIAKAVRDGNTSMYKVGDTKEIKLEGFTNEEPGSNGLYTVRIANTSSDDPICNSSEYTQTACGFVIEFVDIITEHNMNSTKTNWGGWRDSEMRTYIKNDIYNALPEDLRNVIIDTKVVSSNSDVTEETDEINKEPLVTSKDKLYLLSRKEVMGVYGYPIKVETRQLDYYKNGTKGTNKYYNGELIEWWLRSTRLTLCFYGDSGDTHVATESYGVAPAFRIG